MQEVDAIEWVKRNQARFFPGGVIDTVRLLAYVMSDALELGGGECRIVQRGTWWFVVSDADWLAHPALTVQELFERVVPAPAHGEHSMRAEILLRAYAEDVFTKSEREELTIKGLAPDSALIESAVDVSWSRRLIALRMRA